MPSAAMSAYSHRFGSPDVDIFVFLGFGLVGIGLGLMFWLDFRRREVRGGRLAGWIVLVAGSLMGSIAGYLSVQPDDFKRLTADAEQVTLTYFLPRPDVHLAWHEVASVDIRHDRLVLVARSGATYRSPVIYRGDQDRILDTLRRIMSQGTAEQL